jgi:hypothetical protein
MDIISTSSGLIQDNPFAAVGIAAGVGAIAGAGIGLVAGSKSGSSTKKKRKRTTKRSVKKRKYTSKRVKKRVRKTPRTAGKGKDTSTKRIRYTKKGQPYVILKNGRARFIKKSSAKRSRKLKGGRY